MVQCPFASTCWNWIGLQVSDQQDLFQNLESFRRQLQVPFYLEIIILMCWAIWHVRNGLIFNNRLPTINEAKRLFKSEMVLLLVRARRSYFPWIELWINNLLNYGFTSRGALLLFIKKNELIRDYLVADDGR